MQASSDGWSPSAETEVRELTVTPKRPASPSVVATVTNVAARLMPSRNCMRRSAVMASPQIKETLQFDVGHLLAEFVELALPARREGFDKTWSEPIPGELRSAQALDRFWHGAGEVRSGVFPPRAVADHFWRGLDTLDDAGDTRRYGCGDGEVGIGVGTRQAVFHAQR